MTKKEIITQIDSLRDTLLKLDAKDAAFAETIAYFKQRQDNIRAKKREIHKQVTKLKLIITKEEYE